MEKEKKIGLFETYNTEANCIELSLTRIQMVAVTIFAFIFLFWKYVVRNVEISWPDVGLIGVLFVAAFTPKALKETIIQFKK